MKWAALFSILAEVSHVSAVKCNVRRGARLGEGDFLAQQNEFVVWYGSAS